ncbi:MAG: serine/threonine-protein kinase, partial [Myxococcota bacterium]|nr:serine/threonine-protein kinase [Myxococcota bacterium]
VWGGWHRATGTAVAVKVLNPKWADSTLGLRLFQREVQTFARLQHPGIVAVYDHGEISRETAEASAGAMQTGSPYLVSEYVGGGNLVGPEAVNDWPQLRSTLFSVLDSLAHAHARGVIHRDLKPANILRVRASRRVKLTDFGIVHVIGQQNVSAGGGRRTRFVGTPSFASPEQVRADLPSVGPWTDLYALACTLYVLATGLPPYGTSRTVGKENLLQAHMSAPPPPLESRFWVPDGLEAWAHKLLRKDPRDRYRWAADAAAGLLALDQESLPASNPEEMDFLGESTGTLTFVVPEAVRLGMVGGLGYDDPTVLTPMVSGLLDDGSETVRDVHALNSDALSGNITAIMQRDRPEMPADWRQPHFPPEVLHDAGLSIFGMRPIPIVGRERERDRLWSLLQYVVSTGRLKTVLLDGATGTGKSRLARWVCERAHEVGAASVMTIRHAPSQPPWEGLR